MIKSKSSGTFSLCVTFCSILTFCSERPGNITSDTASMVEQRPLSTTVYAPQNRPDVRGQIGAVSAGHPLAAQAGLRVLQEGGNATDAIIAMAGVLAVVRPHMNGIGGDAFGIFYNGATGEPSPKCYTSCFTIILLTTK